MLNKNTSNPIETEKEEANHEIPSITIQESPTDTERPLSPTVATKAVEPPKEKKDIKTHAYLDAVETKSSDGVQSEAHSLHLPYVHSRQSFAQSVSSLYSHFAGERFSPKSSVEEKIEAISVEEIHVDKQEDSISTVSSDNEHEHDVPKASVGKAMFMFLKAFIGSGVLFLPKAFQHGGLVLSPILMILIACICQFAFLRLVRTQAVIGGSFGDIGGALFGRLARYTVLFFIVISQMGFVCSYFVFISGNLLNITNVLSHCAAVIAQRYYIWVAFVAILPLVMVRYIAKLSFAAIIADLFILFGLISVLYFTSKELHTNGMGPDVKAVNSDFALMIGTATFAFEGIGLILPIGEAMEKPEKFPFVMAVGMIIVCTIYILIGGISYMAYGNHIQAAVVYNFPPDSPLTISVQLLYSIAIILTAPLMLFPATKILENGLFKRFPSGSVDLRIKWSKNFFRMILLGICALIAFCIGGENLDLFVALVGSIACVPLCFIFPGLFHYKVATKVIDRIFDIALCVFGIFITIYTLYVTIDSFMNPKNDSYTLPPYCPNHV